jgi:hypothetical protein
MSADNSLCLQLGNSGCDRAEAAAASLHLLRIIARSLRLLTADTVTAPGVIIITTIVAWYNGGGRGVLDQHCLYLAHLHQRIIVHKKKQHVQRRRRDLGKQSMQPRSNSPRFIILLVQHNTQSLLLRKIHGRGVLTITTATTQPVHLLLQALHCSLFGNQVAFQLSQSNLRGKN